MLTKRVLNEWLQDAVNEILLIETMEGYQEKRDDMIKTQKRIIFLTETLLDHTIWLSKNKCQKCGKEYSRSETIRTYGDLWWTGMYCSDECRNKKPC